MEQSKLNDYLDYLVKHLLKIYPNSVVGRSYSEYVIHLSIRIILPEDIRLSEFLEGVEICLNKKWRYTTSFGDVYYFRPLNLERDMRNYYLNLLL